MNTPTLGLDQARLQHLRDVINDDIAKDKYFGAVVSVARHGEPGLQEAFGYGDGAHKLKLATTSVFSLFSLTKAFTTVLTLRAIELGQFALTTRVAEIIPEFAGGQRERITGKGSRLVNGAERCEVIHDVRASAEGTDG